MAQRGTEIRGRGHDLAVPVPAQPGGHAPGEERPFLEVADALEQIRGTRLLVRLDRHQRKAGTQDYGEVAGVIHPAVQLTNPVKAVTSTITPNTIRYQAKMLKSCVAM